jgi:phage gp16-like protein
MPPTNAQRAQIKIAQKELGLVDDDYRAILKVQFNRTSCMQLSTVQAERLIRHFQKLGWVKKSQNKLPGFEVPPDGKSQKILALWITLHKAGPVKDGSDQALMKFVKRMTKTKTFPGKDHLKFCDGQDKFKIIEALKDWAKREDVDVG